jgi:hypothetical protein
VYLAVLEDVFDPDVSRDMPRVSGGYSAPTAFGQENEKINANLKRSQIGK